MAFMGMVGLSIYASGQVISIQDSRPVGELAWQLEERYGVAISYEDPPYVYGDDIVDISEEVNRQSPRSKSPVLVPRDEAIDFDPIKVKGNSIEVLQGRITTSLNKYSEVSGSRFGLHRRGEMLIIAPLNFKSKTGNFQTLRPILDNKITVPSKSRSGTEFLQDFCSALTRATGTKFHLGTYPVNLFSGSKTTLGIENTSARDALLSLFSETRQRLSWQLLYGPDEQDFVLNIRVVPNVAAAVQPVQ